MKISKLIKYDVKQGFRENVGRLAVLVGIILLFCIDFKVHWQNCCDHMDGKMPKGTYIDYLFYFLAGAKEYVPGLDESVPFPARWLLLHSYLLYGGLSYSVRDLAGMGAVILTKAETRWKWWLSKCLWNGIYITCAYLLVYLTTLLWCIGAKENLSLSVTASVMNKMLDITALSNRSPIGLIIYILFVPLCMMISMSMLQWSVSLFVPPAFSFIFMEIIFIFSIYFCNGWFFANYAMPLRSEYVKWQGFVMEDALVVAVLLCIFCVVIGGRRFQKFDILPKEN